MDRSSGSEGSTESKPRYAKNKCPQGLKTPKEMINVRSRQDDINRRATECLSVWRMALVKCSPRKNMKNKPGELSKGAVCSRRDKLKRT